MLEVSSIVVVNSCFFLCFVLLFAVCCWCKESLLQLFAIRLEVNPAVVFKDAACVRRLSCCIFLAVCR